MKKWEEKLVEETHEYLGSSEELEKFDHGQVKCL